MQIKQPNQRLPELDALRGIACILVLLFHYTMEYDVAKYGFVYGVTGVDLFFIISGFVILMSLEKVKKGKDFIVSRFSRLFPTYWSCLTLTTIIILTHRYFKQEYFSPIIYQYSVNLSMIQYYFKVDDMEGVYWSLIIELLFYLFMFIVFSFKQVKRIELIATCALVITVFYHFVLKKYFADVYDHLNWWFPLLNHFPLFFAGILFYKMKFSGQTVFRYFLIACCFVVQVFLFEDGGRSRGSILQWEYSIVLSVYFGLFILYVNNLLSFIVNRVTLYLGTISYSLYLIHQSLRIIPFLTTQYTKLNWVLSTFAIALPISILLASLVTFYVEKPVMRYIANRYKKTT